MFHCKSLMNHPQDVQDFLLITDQEEIASLWFGSQTMWHFKNRCVQQQWACSRMLRKAVTQSQTRNHLHYSACTLPTNFNPKWVLLDEHIIEATLRGAWWSTGNVQRDWNFIPTVVGIIDLGQKKSFYVTTNVSHYILLYHIIQNDMWRFWIPTSQNFRGLKHQIS